MTFAYFSPFRNHPNLKHLVASIARTLANGSLYAFKKPAGRSSIPRAFYGAIRLRVACISSRVTSWLMLMSRFKGRALSRGGLASGLGKKRYYSRVAFS